MPKLLIVEDSPKERLIYQHLLDCYQLFPGDYQSLDSGDSLHFLKATLNESAKWPDVVLLDLDMTEACGWKFLTELEPLITKVNKEVDVYIVSSTLTFHDKEQVFSLAFIKDHFLKPLNRHTLITLNSIYGQAS